MTARLQIRAKVYRGVDGFTISGTNDRGHRIRIHTRTRASAEHIKAKELRGEEINLADFQDIPPKETPMSRLTVTEDSYGWKYEGGEEPPTDFQCACGHPMSAHAEPTGEREPYGYCRALNMDVLDMHRPGTGWDYGDAVIGCDSPSCGVTAINWWEHHAAIIRAAVCDCAEGWPVESGEPQVEPCIACGAPVLIEWAVASDDGSIYEVEGKTQENAEREAALLREPDEEGQSEPGARAISRSVGHDEGCVVQISADHADGQHDERYDHDCAECMAVLEMEARAYRPHPNSLPYAEQAEGAELRRKRFA